MVEGSVNQSATNLNMLGGRSSRDPISQRYPSRTKRVNLNVPISVYCMLPVVILSRLWLLFFISGYFWKSAVNVGYQWLLLVISGFSWLFLVIVGYSLFSLVISGYR